jgi:16S rRNA G966 N2-methylase RsmD
MPTVKPDDETGTRPDMPFAYYGAKHRLATKYPRPQHDTIIEPFAGSAAYSVRWATDSTRVILYDLDPAVIELWQRLQNMTMAELDAITRHVEHDQKTTDPLIAAPAGSESFQAALNGKSRQITPYMRDRWPLVKRRIIRSLPRIINWEIVHGTYADIPNINATWFIDPPYSVHDLGYTTRASASGNGYRHGASGINYDHLSDWCQTRPGQIIVCEQHPANWLPFQPFHTQKNQQLRERTEVIWTNTPTDTTQPLTLF